MNTLVQLDWSTNPVAFQPHRLPMLAQELQEVPASYSACIEATRTQLRSLYLPYHQLPQNHPSQGGFKQARGMSLLSRLCRLPQTIRMQTCSRVIRGVIKLTKGYLSIVKFCSQITQGCPVHAIQKLSIIGARWLSS
jgi:hypothetical protein